jgi:hypothetical protein
MVKGECWRFPVSCPTFRSHWAFNWDKDAITVRGVMAVFPWDMPWMTPPLVFALTALALIHALYCIGDLQI